MRSINKVILIGNVTRDPEIRKTPNEQTVATFGLATNREWMTRDGRKQNLAEFHNCVAWANLAEICEKFIKKGKLLYLEGYLKTRSWDSPEGIRKFKTEVVVQDIIMLDKRDSTSDSAIAEEEEHAEGTAEPAGEAATEEVEAKEEVKEEKPSPKKEAKEEEPSPKEEAKEEEPSPKEEKEEAEKEPEEEKKAVTKKKPDEKKPEAAVAAGVDIDSDLGL